MRLARAGRARFSVRSSWGSQHRAARSSESTRHPHCTSARLDAGRRRSDPWRCSLSDTLAEDGEDKYQALPGRHPPAGLRASASTARTTEAAASRALPPAPSTSTCRGSWTRSSTCAIAGTTPTRRRSRPVSAATARTATAWASAASAGTGGAPSASTSPRRRGGRGSRAAPRDRVGVVPALPPAASGSTKTHKSPFSLASDPRSALALGLETVVRLHYATGLYAGSTRRLREANPCER